MCVYISGLSVYLCSTFLLLSWRCLNKDGIRSTVFFFCWIHSSGCRRIHDQCLFCRPCCRFGCSLDRGVPDLNYSRIYQKLQVPSSITQSNYCRDPSIKVSSARLHWVLLNFDERKRSLKGLSRVSPDFIGFTKVWMGLFVYFFLSLLFFTGYPWFCLVWLSWAVFTGFKWTVLTLIEFRLVSPGFCWVPTEIYRTLNLIIYFLI